MAGLQCFENPPAPSSFPGEGHVGEVAGLKSYITGSSTSKYAVLLISDVFGFEAPNLRKLADKVAVSGYFVVVPDLLQRDYFKPDDAARPISSWLKDHAPEEAFEATKPAIEELKAKGAVSVGAVGFCWGAKVVVKLAKAGDVEAVVMLHPSLVTLEDMKATVIPISVLAAEHDLVTPPELVRSFEDALGEKPEVKSFVKIFEGVSHGWSVRYDTENEEAVKRAAEAHGYLLDWLDHHVKSNKY